MRLSLLSASLMVVLLPGAAVAQTANLSPAPTGSGPQLMTAAPVPDELPRTTLRYGGRPNSMADVISPPGIGSSFAGPINSTPFSTTPSASWPPDAAMPDGRDSVAGGAGGGMVPNVDQ